MPRKREDLTGRKFGKLTVIGYDRTNNKRSCKYITYNDETRTISEWSRIFNVNYSVFMSRVKRGDMRDFEDYFGGKEYG